jgi:hypothetical protein
MTFQALPESDPDFIDFGTLRLKKKAKNHFVISGEFEVKQNFGNEFNVGFL